MTAVNDAPAGTDKTLTALEDQAHTFAAADFGFSDPNDSPANTFVAVIITTLPAAGSLEHRRRGRHAGRRSALPPSPGDLTFTPAANANGTAYTTFTFQVHDDGGTANGGDDTDQSANTSPSTSPRSTTRRRIDAIATDASTRTRLPRRST